MPFDMTVLYVAMNMADADSLTTWVRDGAVKLRMTDSGYGSEPPVTLIAALKEVAERIPDNIALGESRLVFICEKHRL